LVKTAKNIANWVTTVSGPRYLKLKYADVLRLN